MTNVKSVEVKSGSAGFNRQSSDPGRSPFRSDDPGRSPFRSDGPRRKRFRQAGFTLIEVLLAFILFIVIATVFAISKSDSERNVRQNMRRDLAIRLLQGKMTEWEMKMQRLVNKNGVEQSYTEESGTFDEPYQDYTWTMKFDAPTIKFTSQTLIKFLTDLGMDKDEAMAQIEQQKLMFTNLNKNIENNFGELQVEVSWEYIGKQKLRLLTHIVPRDPKIELITTAESE